MQVGLSTLSMSCRNYQKLTLKNYAMEISQRSKVLSQTAKFAKTSTVAESSQITEVTTT
jgi:hypothetical protein